LAQQRGKKDEAIHWRNLAEQAKAALLQRFWTGDRFLRGFSPDGHPDPTPDASVLGVLFPFGILDLTNPTERRIGEATVQQVLRELTRETPDGGLAVWRFAGDGYAWGMASTPATLWLGLAASVLSRAQGDEWQTIALRCLQGVMNHTTPAGLLAEMFDAFGHGYWAAGHGWSAGWLWLLALSIAANR
jgi:GH15 family glucan-1,4-alpha-glucosidase